ncbi:hypothetical protein FOZ63_020932, partial [Perkinsus olseni]
VWYEIISDVVSNLNHLPYSEDCWITPAMLCFGFFDPAEFYKSNPSLDNLTNKLVANESHEAVMAHRQHAQDQHKLRMVDYLRHWVVYREKSRARVLTAHGRPCDLQQGDLVYHLVDSPKAKLSSRVLGPYTVSDIEPGRATAVVAGFNGSTSRVWVSNLIKVPKDDVFGSGPKPSPSTSSSSTSSSDSCPTRRVSSSADGHQS